MTPTPDREDTATQAESCNVMDPGVLDARAGHVREQETP